MRMPSRLAVVAMLMLVSGCAAPVVPSPTLAAGALADPPVPKALNDGLDAIAARYGIEKAWFTLSRDTGATVGTSRGDTMGIARPLEIGSLSKSVTAIGIAALIQDKRLTLRTRLSEILPGYVQGMGHQLDPSLAPLDIEHLLAHRGGLRTNVTSDAATGLSSGDMLARLPQGAHFSEYLLAGNDHSDGTSEYRYSNLSYVLLGMVIEAVAKQPYETFIQQRVFQPVGVTGRIMPSLRSVAPFSGWAMTKADLLRLWTVFDVNHPSLLDRPTLEATLLSRALPPTATGTDVHYTTGTNVRQSADRRSYVINHNGIVDFLSGEPNVYSYAEKYVPGYAWMYVYETPPRSRSREMRAVVHDIRGLVDGVEARP